MKCGISCSYIYISQSKRVNRKMILTLLIDLKAIRENVYFTNVILEKIVQKSLCWHRSYDENHVFISNSVPS